MIDHVINTPLLAFASLIFIGTGFATMDALQSADKDAIGDAQHPIEIEDHERIRSRPRLGDRERHRERIRQPALARSIAQAGRAARAGVLAGRDLNALSLSTASNHATIAHLLAHHPCALAGPPIQSFRVKRAV